MEFVREASPFQQCFFERAVLKVVKRELPIWKCASPSQNHQQVCLHCEPLKILQRSDTIILLSRCGACVYIEFISAQRGTKTMRQRAVMYCVCAELFFLLGGTAGVHARKKRGCVWVACDAPPYRTHTRAARLVRLICAQFLPRLIALCH